MDAATIFAIVAMSVAGLTIAVGAIAPALSEGRAVVAALDAIARQPDAADSVTRTLFIGLALIESLAIYSLVIALIILFANPFLGLIGR